MIERGQSENSHALGSSDLKDCVDERRDSGAFSEYDKATEKKHHNENGYQPILLSGAQKPPEFAEERYHGSNWFFMDSGAEPGGDLWIQ